MQRFLWLFLVSCLTVGLAPAVAQSTADGPPSALAGFSSALDVEGGFVFAGEGNPSHVPGRVYVYGASEGAWTQTARLEARDGSVGDGFGTALDAAGDRLAVGASGAAFVFERDGDTWSQVARVVPNDSLATFGSRVALAGDVLFVSATPQDEERSRTSAPSRDAVFVFERESDGSWTQSDVLTGASVQPGDGFGSALAASDAHLLVGAPGVQGGGGVVVFRRDADDGTWRETQMVQQRDRRARLGTSVALAGDVALAGAPRANDGTGAAHVLTFDADADGWRITGRLQPFDGMARFAFGTGVAFDGSRAWVGAPGADEQIGAVYHFRWDAASGSWTDVARHTHPEAEADDRLGATVAAQGDVAAVGLPGDDYGAGTVTVFTPDDADDWTTSPLLAPPVGDGLAAITGDEVPCSDGDASGYSCEQIDLLSFLPVHQIGGKRGIEVNDIWGWTDPETGREYALVGRVDGTSFVDVSDPSNPVFVATLPLTEGATGAIWRDIKVYENHAFIVADNAGEHGMQIVDLTQLRDVAPEAMPVTFEETAHYDGIHSAHNVVINEATGFAYVVGSSGGGQTCGGGLHMVNIQTPTEPAFAGCFSDPSTGRTGTGYTHDAQCVIYEGPDAEHQGREICFGANETALSIADVTDKQNPKALSTGSYPDHAYVHQGWLTEDQRYFYLNDELDEINGLADRTRTLVWDVSDLDDPQLVNEFLLPERSTDHNLYVKGQTMYQSNYVSGLRVVDVSDPVNPKEVAHFDTVPYGDNGPGFGGSWSNYPYFESGTIIVTSMQEGLFLLKRSDPEL